MDVINAPELTMVNPTTNILTDDGLSDKIVTEIQRVDQQSDQFSGIHRVASIFMHYSRCCNVYLDEMVSRLATESVASKSELKQQHEIIQELQKQLKTLSDIHRMNPQTFLGEGQQLHQAQVEQEPTVEATDRTHLVVSDNDTVTTNERLSPSDSVHVEQPDEMEGAQSSTHEFNEGSVIATQPNDEVSLNAEQDDESEEVRMKQLTMVNPTTRIFADVGLPDKTVTEIENLEQQPEQFNDVDNHSTYLDEMVAKLATESVTLKTQVKQQHEMILQWEKQLKTLIGIHRMNHPTFFGEGNHKHRAHVEQEPTVEDSHQSQLEIAEIDTMNEQSFRSDSGQMKQPQAIESVQSHTEECNEENVNVTRSNDDVSLDVGQLNESEEAVQSPGHLLRTQIRLGLRKLDGKKIAYSPRITDTSHKNPPNCRKGSKIHTCKKCKKQFNRKYKLTIHLSVHRGEKPFQCQECSAAFKQSGNLKRHQRIHTGEKPFQCKECSAAFSESGSLKGHQRIHAGEKPYQCKECSSAFRDLSGFKKHQLIHTGEKPFQCKECSAAFSQSGSLRGHQRIHTGEKPYQCKECSSAFRSLSGLKKHQLIHTGEKPFMCDICKKTYRLKQTLSRHMSTHTGKKSHKCNVCQKEFRFRSNMRAHHKLHGKEMRARP